MQGSYTYIPETNHVPREYSVAAILSLLFMVSISLVPALALLHFYVSTFRSMFAVPNMAVFCSSFISWFPSMLLMYFLNDFGNGPSRSYYYWYHPCFYIPHALYFFVRSLYFKIFSASFLITFLSTEIIIIIIIITIIIIIISLVTGLFFLVLLLNQR